MLKKFTFLLLLIMSFLALKAQDPVVTLTIIESEGGCNLSTDCSAEVACCDLLIEIDQPDWELRSYNVWTAYPSPTMSYNNDNPCKPGEIGRIVVTSLDNFAMPLIRSGPMLYWRLLAEPVLS